MSTFYSGLAAQPAAPIEDALTFWGAAPPPTSTYSYQIPGYQYAYGPLLPSSTSGGATQRFPQSTLADLPQTQNVGSYITPNLPTWLIPIVGSLFLLMLVNFAPSFYRPTVVFLCGLILYWIAK